MRGFVDLASLFAILVIVLVLDSSQSQPTIFVKDLPPTGIEGLKSGRGCPKRTTLAHDEMGNEKRDNYEDKDDENLGGPTNPPDTAQKI